MLIKFKVENFKNFNTPLEIDFTKIGKYDYNTNCLKDDIISKMLIYGRNATGKTNLGYAIMDIRSNLDELNYHLDYQDNFLNINADKDYAYFEYTFKFDDDIVIYSYKKSSSLSLFEEILKINDEIIFKCDFKNNKNIYQNLKIIDADTINISIYEDYINKFSDDFDNKIISFLRWIINNSALNENNILFKMNNFVKNMRILTIKSKPSKFHQLVFGIFTEEIYSKDKLSEFERFLNNMGIECKLHIKLIDDKPKLYFDYNGKFLSFFENLSSGTRIIVDIYKSLVMRKSSSPINFLFLDEFDAFYHYELAERLLDYFKSELKYTQIIMTTHNTNLMSNKIMRPDCLFILSTDGNLTPLNKATSRDIKKIHNLEKMYISGEFEDYE